MVAMNFAYEDEAEKFFGIVMKIVNKRKRTQSTPKISKSSSSAPKESKLKRLTKDLIGSPSNFTHVSHMGSSGVVQKLSDLKFLESPVRVPNAKRAQPRHAPPPPPKDFEVPSLSV